LIHIHADASDRDVLSVAVGAPFDENAGNFAAGNINIVRPFDESLTANLLLDGRGDDCRQHVG